MVDLSFWEASSAVILGVVYFYIPAPSDFVGNLFTGLFLAVQGLAFGFLWFEEQSHDAQNSAS